MPRSRYPSRLLESTTSPAEPSGPKSLSGTFFGKSGGENKTRSPVLKSSAGAEKLARYCTVRKKNGTAKAWKYKSVLARSKEAVENINRPALLFFSTKAAPAFKNRAAWMASAPAQ